MERDDVLFFVTTRTIEERYWLHPLLTCGMCPPNRKARRGLSRLEAHADKRVARLVKLANANRRPQQAVLDVCSAKRIARGNVGSAIARAQAHYGVEVFAVVVMSNEDSHYEREQ